ncbi:MAG: hypothetical protein H7A51_16645 [Akkermansiaceae bacterium]|nr:hypothetical protein [Akkermansiaceae bacterium]
MKSIGNAPKRLPGTPAGVNDGFALIATISVMILLVMVALALLSLSATTTRSLNNDKAQAEARANARLALMVALGQIQKNLGPDQRITATAAVLDPSPPSSSASSSSYPNAYWTGVWRSDNTMEPSNYQARKTDLFESWLVSLRDLDSATALGTAATAISGAQDTALVLGQGTTDAATDAQNVHAEILAAPSGGGFAWWVADESVKARLNLPGLPKVGASTPELQALLQSAPLAGSKMSASLDWLDTSSDADQDRNNLRRLITLHMLATHPQNPDGRPGNYHDFSTTTMSLPVDVREGGMKWDLSRLFGNDTLAASHRRSARMATAGTLIPTEMPIYETGNPQGIFPSWQRLADYHRLAQFIKWDGYNPYLSYEGSGMTSVWGRIRRLHCQPPLPVLVRMQLFFSLAAQNGRIGLVIEPVCTFWNPYNIEIRVPYDSGVMRLYSWWPSCRIRVQRGGSGLYQPALTGYSTSVFQYSADAGPNAHMGFDIAGMTLKPGETLVYSDVSNRPTHWDNRFAQYGRSVTAVPGWSEKGGLLGYSSSGQCYGGPISGAESISVTTTFDAIPTRYDGHFSQGKHLLFHRLIMHKAGPGVDKLASGDTYRGLQSFGIHDISTKEYHETLHTNGTIVRNNIQGAALLAGKKEPLFVIDMAARTEEKGDAGTVPIDDPQVLPFLHTSWSHGSIIGGDTLNESEKVGGYWDAFVYKVSDWDNQGVEIEPKTHRGYFGSGNTAETGVNFVTMKEIPTRAPLSLAAYRNFDLLYNPLINQLGYGQRSDASEYSADPATSFIIGGGYAHPLVGKDKVVLKNAIKNRTDKSNYDYFDHSYLANWALFDRYFHSGLPPLWSDDYQNQSQAERTETLREIVSGASREHVENPRFVWRKSSDESVATNILDEETGHERVAERLSFAGFNVNSTSVEAWRAFLGTMQSATIPRHNGEALTPGMADNYPDYSAAYPRQQIVNDLLADDVLMTNAGLKNKSLLWNGFKSLESDEIEKLAVAIVEQVKARGPFFSMADFVNRRLSNSGGAGGNPSDFTKSSALQAAIDATDINTQNFKVFQNDNSTSFANPDAATGLRAAGAPAYLMQGDLLQALGSTMTVRADTFTVRAYGESKDAQGNVIARAWCEAVVQRNHDYIDSTNQAHQTGDELTQTNKLFGRKLNIVSFRWLGKEEV